ncbi:cbb3-type cytochrome oxidase subunit 3 [Gemmatimonas sp.]|jgi:cbb3-type cytochrome oxidase subunit 3|uniref:cbb3-type cytochrome oxidase subunit 3 n=1 Tax=Gemmatimonas sp. TaxID=1962908 RepID=UPI0037BFD40B
MKLSDIMSYAQLSVYTEVALVLFLGVFIAIAIHTFLPSRRRELDAASRIPLEDDGVRTPRTMER